MFGPNGGIWILILIPSRRTLSSEPNIWIFIINKLLFGPALLLTTLWISLTWMTENLKSLLLLQSFLKLTFSTQTVAMKRTLTQLGGIIRPCLSLLTCRLNKCHILWVLCITEGRVMSAFARETSVDRKCR